MCFAPQPHALFQHLNFQKWSGNGVFCTFWLGNVLRATTACNFSSLISPDVSAPAALASLLFDPPEPQNHEKTMFRDFPTFSRTCIFFLLIFSLLTLLPADCFFISPYCRKFDFQTSFDKDKETQQALKKVRASKTCVWICQHQKAERNTPRRRQRS